MYSAQKLNEQGDNIQPWHTPFPIWNQSVVPCPVLTVASWPPYKFSRSRSGGLVFPSFQNFPQFIVIPTVKGFGIVNKAEIDVSLELSCFFNDPADVGNLISGSSAFSKTILLGHEYTSNIDYMISFCKFHTIWVKVSFFSPVMNIKCSPFESWKLYILKNYLNTESSFIVHQFKLSYLDIRILSFVGNMHNIIWGHYHILRKKLVHFCRRPKSDIAR